MSRFILPNALVLAIRRFDLIFSSGRRNGPAGALDLHKMKQGWGEAKIDQSVTGKPLTIGGETSSTAWERTP